jgi:endo-1,4-beta-mannosidase
MYQPIVMGVNYWPRKKAMYWLSDFDPGEVEEEFAIIKDLGLTLVRIFLLWEEFQPAPHEISISTLANLVTVCDIANSHQLQLDVTFFTGHISGPEVNRFFLDIT